MLGGIRTRHRKAPFHGARRSRAKRHEHRRPLPQDRIKQESSAAQTQQNPGVPAQLTVGIHTWPSLQHSAP